jgi:hypothetical protein
VETDNGVRVDERLFNLQTDPAERKDLLPAEPERAGRLKEKLHAWEQEVTAPRLQAFHRQER